MATDSSILAGSIPWTEEPGGLQSTGSQRVGHDRVTEHSTLLSVFPKATPRGLTEREGLCARAPVCACVCLYVSVCSRGFPGLMVHTFCFGCSS